MFSRTCAGRAGRGTSCSGRARGTSPSGASWSSRRSLRSRRPAWGNGSGFCPTRGWSRSSPACDSSRCRSSVGNERLLLDGRGNGQPRRRPAALRLGGLPPSPPCGVGRGVHPPSRARAATSFVRKPAEPNPATHSRNDDGGFPSGLVLLRKPYRTPTLALLLSPRGGSTLYVRGRNHRAHRLGRT